MPHIHLETTADLPENADVPDILQALVEAVSAQEAVARDSVSATHCLLVNWAVGEDAPEGFARCTVSILTDRPAEWRRDLAARAFETLRARFGLSLEAGEVALSLEVREMDAATYLRA